MKIKITAITLMSLLLFSACNNIDPTADKTLGSSGIIETKSDSTAADETELSETEILTAYEPTESDLAVAEWFENYMTDEEYFSDLKSYQYYARTLGKDKDFFSDPSMWEVYYSKTVNINADVDEQDTYIIRLDPNKLMEVYAENNETTVDELCTELSVSRAQLYYNWGYDPANENYAKEHEKNTATYSDRERDIFGADNGEDRKAVMSSHMIVADREEETAEYSSEMSDTLRIKRRDTLNAFTENGKFYSDFLQEEKEPAFKINGIGIRAVIPMTLPNAFADAAENGSADISIMINESPFVYGCTDDDRINMAMLIEYLNN